MESPIAFIGATGGCVNACLAHTLKNGYYAVALARTPSKLISLLRSQNISQEILETRLRIVQGDALDPESVRSTILVTNSSSTPSLVPHIITGIGGQPKIRNMHIEFDSPNICEESTRSLLTALREVYSVYPEAQRKRPLLTVISGMGIDPSEKLQDVPFWIRWPYHKILQVPHADKWKMEVMLGEDEAKGLFVGVVVVRPGSFLTGDHLVMSGKGLDKVRVGNKGSPVVGYTVARADVGEWIFREIVTAGGRKWMGEKVTLSSW